MFFFLIVGLQLFLLVARRIQERRQLANWRSEAVRLGLHASDAFPALEMSGEWRGVRVEINHSVVERYKQAPLVHHALRAQLEDESWYERKGPGFLPPESLESELNDLIRAARRRAEP